jgi:hypothetical protein
MRRGGRRTSRASRRPRGRPSDPATRLACPVEDLQGLSSTRHPPLQHPPLVEPRPSPFVATDGHGGKSGWYAVRECDVGPEHPRQPSRNGGARGSTLQRLPDDGAGCGLLLTDHCEEGNLLAGVDVLDRRPDVARALDHLVGDDPRPASFREASGSTRWCRRRCEPISHLNGSCGPGRTSDSASEAAPAHGEVSASWAAPRTSLGSRNGSVSGFAVTTRRRPSSASLAGLRSSGAGRGCQGWGPEAGGATGSMSNSSVAMSTVEMPSTIAWCTCSPPPPGRR